MAAPAPVYTAEQIATVDKRIAAQCHPKQRNFVFDLALWISLLCNRGAGKTMAAVMRLIRRMVRESNQNCLFIAETRDQAERLAWKDLKRLVASLRLGAVKFNESELTCTLPNGSTLLLFGCDDKKDIGKLRGPTWHEIVVDEAASIKNELLEELLFEVIGPRAVGAVVLQGTPGKRLEGLFYDATRLGSPEHLPYAERDNPDFAGEERMWSSHRWHIRDGVEHGIAAMAAIYAKQLDNLKRLGWGPDHPRRRREYDGEWAADDTTNVYTFKPHLDDGTEWNVWDPQRDARGFAVLPRGLADIGYGIGIDVGFKDAFALEVAAFSYTDPRRALYHVYEVYRTRVYARALAQLLIGEALNHERPGGIFGVIGWPAVLVGDFAGAGGALLLELKEVYGITVIATDKPYKYKDNAIELCNGDLVDGRHKIMKGSALEREMTTLQWVVDQYGRRAENKSQANHACDGWMYLRNAVAPLLPSAASAPSPDDPAPKTARQRFIEDDEIIPEQPEIGDANAMYDDEAGGFQPGEW